MSEGMSKSKMILIIASETYFSKPFGQLEIQLALNVNNDQKKKIIVVKIGRGSLAKLPHHIKVELGNHMCLQWPEQEVRYIINSLA